MISYVNQEINAVEEKLGSLPPPPPSLPPPPPPSLFVDEEFKSSESFSTNSTGSDESASKEKNRGAQGGILLYQTSLSLLIV